MATSIISASPLFSLAADWYQRATAGTLTDTDFERWFTMYPRAVAEATPVEFNALVEADCAVEAAQRLH